MLKRLIRIHKIANKNISWGLKYSPLKLNADLPVDETWKKLKADALEKAGYAFSKAKKITDPEFQFLNSDPSAPDSPEKLAAFIDAFITYSGKLMSNFDSLYKEFSYLIDDYASEDAYRHVERAIARAEHMPALINNDQQLLNDFKNFRTLPYLDRVDLLVRLIEEAQEGKTEDFEQRDFTTAVRSLLPIHKRENSDRFSRDYRYISDQIEKTYLGLRADLLTKLEGSRKYMEKRKALQQEG